MNLHIIYKTLNWVGILLFLAGVIGDANSVPYLRHGAILGPILFGIGTLLWIPLRFKKPILHPFNSHEYKSSGDALIAFIINNFVLEFWGFCCVLGMLLVIGGGSAIKSSSGFDTAIQKIQDDVQLTELIGEFKGVGTLIGGSTNQSKIDLDFSAYGTTGGTRVNIELEKESGNWKVITLKFK